jgi:ABC-type sugar transport system ATPase subunit
MSEVSLLNVNKHYGELQVIHNVSLTVNDGEFVVFVGPSGCGKSTLLRAIAGLEDITDGELRIGGKLVNDVPPSDREVAMVFQSYALYPHMSVRSNMEFGLKVNKVDAAERQKRIEDTAKILQLEEYLDRKPAQLSGGQRQRVAIGRAIVKQPRVFLFDEPLSNLDAALRVQMRVELDNLHKTLGTTMIYVTHDQVEAMTLADKIVVLNDGRTEQIGRPMDLYHRPRTKFVAGFIGSPKMNFLEVEIKSENGQADSVVYGESVISCPGFELAGLMEAGDRLTLGIRPEHLSLCAREESELQGVVRIVEALGNETNIYVGLPNDDQVVVRDQTNPEIRRGETVGLRVEAGNEHLFSSDGTALQRVEK